MRRREIDRKRENYDKEIEETNKKDQWTSCYNNGFFHKFHSDVLFSLNELNKSI